MSGGNDHDGLGRLRKLVAGLDDRQRRAACMSLAADIDHWRHTTSVQASRVLALAEDVLVADLWADAELFTFALAALRRGIEAATIVSPHEQEQLAAILANFDKATPNAKVARNRLTHFDEWGLKPGGGAIISQTRGRVVIQVGAPEVDPGYVRLHVAQAVEDGDRYGAAAAKVLRRAV